MKDYYQILGVSKGASAEEIRQRRDELRRQFGENIEGL